MTTFRAGPKFPDIWGYVPTQLTGEWQLAAIRRFQADIDRWATNKRLQGPLFPRMEIVPATWKDYSRQFHEVPLCNP